MACVILGYKCRLTVVPSKTFNKQNLNGQQNQERLYKYIVCKPPTLKVVRRERERERERERVLILKTNEFSGYEQLNLYAKSFSLTCFI